LTVPPLHAPVADRSHGLPAREILLLLESDDTNGLGGREVAARQERFGPNELPAALTTGPLRRLLRQLNSPLIYVLLVSGIVTLAIGEHVDSAVIFGVVVLNAVVGYVQESKAEAALDALRALVSTSARVVRDGRLLEVPSAELVPGDLVLVEAGEKVPADLRLVREDELEADESALTGESAPVTKDELVLDAGTTVADRRNMLWSGTLVTAGSGAGIAVATGGETQLGAVHRLIGSAQDLRTPLTRKLATFSVWLTFVILGLAAATFALGVLRGDPAADMFLASVALAVAAIPEGLPAAVTVTLAIGVNRMARRRAVVRRMPAVETLGSTTVICTDKTGTLTENQMTVRAVWTPGGQYRLRGSGYAPEGELTDEAGRPVAPEADAALQACLLAGLACNDARLVREGDAWSVVGDPTEGALLVSAAKVGQTPSELRRTRPRIATVPFSSERQWMATLHDDRVRGGPTAYVKGSPERLLALCRGQMQADGSVAELQPEQVHEAVQSLAGEGLRVLALATAAWDDAIPFDEDSLPGRLVLVGLQVMLDPPREAARSAVGACRSAGIAVKMITGDHAATAYAIGRDLGLLEASGGVLTGPELDELPAETYGEVVDRTAVFARVSPEQKLHLVRALQERGHVAAMTGDGVNDAPALRQADIGVAMGRGGTEVAKEAADIVLTDDDFATIEAAVEEGRGVFDNLTKFLVWTLPTNTGQALVILLAVLVGTALPVLPVQILWINMTTAVALGLMLAFEPKESAIMLRQPRDPSQPLLSRALLSRILLVTSLLVATTWTLFTWERAGGASLDQARTAAMNLFVAVSILYLFSCRSLTRPARELGLLSNRWVLGGVAVQVTAQLCLTYLPPMQVLFDTAALDPGTWARIGLLAMLCSSVIAADKRLRPIAETTPVTSGRAA
jgi:cation-transporting P-type ATPase F